MSKKVAVYTSPLGKPQRQVGDLIKVIGDPKFGFVIVRFPGDRSTYKFHRKQVRLLTPACGTRVTRTRLEFAIASIYNNALVRHGMNINLGRSHFLVDLCKELGI